MAGRGKNGGARVGSGRKPGIPNKATLEHERLAAKTGILPRDYMLSVMRDEKASKHRRDFMATAVAPYIHPRLASVNVNDTTPRRDYSDIDARIFEVMLAFSQGRTVRVAGVASDSRTLRIGARIANEEGNEE